MSTTEQIRDALQTVLEPGERVEAFRSVVTAKVEERTYETSLAMLGPSVFNRAAGGSMTGDGAVPDRTNFVVVTDRRLLWCHKSRLGNEITVGGSDSLGALAAVESVPARVALAKLRFVFADRAVAQFDLPSDHRIDDFVADVSRLLPGMSTAA